MKGMGERLGYDYQHLHGPMTGIWLWGMEAGWDARFDNTRPSLNDKDKRLVVEAWPAILDIMVVHNQELQTSLVALFSLWLFIRFGRIPHVSSCCSFWFPRPKRPPCPWHIATATPAKLTLGPSQATSVGWLDESTYKLHDARDLIRICKYANILALYFLTVNTWKAILWSRPETHDQRCENGALLRQWRWLGAVDSAIKWSVKNEHSCLVMSSDALITVTVDDADVGNAWADDRWH